MCLMVRDARERKRRRFKRLLERTVVTDRNVPIQQGLLAPAVVGRSTTDGQASLAVTGEVAVAADKPGGAAPHEKQKLACWPAVGPPAVVGGEERRPVRGRCVSPGVAALVPERQVGDRRR